MAVDHDIQAEVARLSDEAVILAAALAGRQALRQEASGPRAGPMGELVRQIETAADSAFKVGAKPRLPTASRRKLARSARASLVTLAATEAGMGLVRTALGTASQGVSTYGIGDEAAKLVRNVAYAIVLTLLTAKVSGDIDLGWLRVELEPGVPDGFQSVVEAIRSTVTGAAQGIEEARPGTLMGAPAASSDSSALERNDHPIAKDEALELRNEVWHWLQQNADLPWLDDPHACLTRGPAKEGPARWPTPERAYRVDVGVFRNINSNPGRGDVWRLAVRLQSPLPFRERPFRVIETYLKERVGRIVSVRPTGHVQSFNRGRVGRWQGPRSLAIGAPISTQGGTVGAIGAFVRKPSGDAVYLLSSGHVLTDYGRSGTGSPVFNPPGHVMPTPDQLAAHLFDYRMFDLDAFNQSGMEIAIASGRSRLDAGTAEIVAPRRREFQDTARQLLHIGQLEGVAADGPNYEQGGFVLLRKAAAATDVRQGLVTAERVIVTVTMPDLSVVVGIDLIEVSGQSRVFGGPGDSGALCVDADRKGVGLLVAGAKRAAIVNDGRGVGYIVPMEAIMNDLVLELV